jgi:hypothetical protein
VLAAAPPQLATMHRAPADGPSCKAASAAAAAGAAGTAVGAVYTDVLLCALTCCSGYSSAKVCQRSYAM